jgi:PST family polysaccharide transporter
VSGDASTFGEADPLTVVADRAMLKRQSVRGAGMTLAAQGVRCGLQFASQVALAHFLAPRDFGLVAMVAPMLSLVQIFNEMGLTQATVQRARISQAELSALFWINLAVSLCLAAILAAAAPAIAWFYHAPRLAGITLACASLLILSGAGAQQIALLNRRMQFSRLATIDITCSLAACVVGLAASWQGLGAWALVLMQAANSLTILVLAWAFTGWLPSGPRRWRNVAELLRFGSHLTGFNLLAYAEGNLGAVLIGRLSGAVALGLYDRAYKLVIVPWWQVSLPVARVAVSLLSRLCGAPADYVSAWRRMLQGLMLIAAPGLLWAALTSDTLVPALLGQAWRPASPLVCDLALATLLVPFGASGYWLFVSQGRVAEQLRLGMVSGVALVLSAVVGAHWGALGVARCYALFAPFVQGIHFWGATRRGPVGGRAAWLAVWPVLPGLAAAAASVAALQSFLPQADFLPVLLTCCYAACGLAMLSFPSGRRIVREIWAMRLLMSGAAPRSYAAGAAGRVVQESTSF